MFDLYEKRKIRRFFFSRILTGLLFVLCMFLAYSAWGAYQKVQFARGGNIDAQREKETLEARAEVLEADIARLSTDRGIEAELRSRFDVGREGEHLVVLLDAPAQSVADEDTDAFWSKVQAWLGF